MNLVRCTKCGGVTEREEEFLDLPVTIEDVGEGGGEGGRCLERALESHVV